MSRLKIVGLILIALAVVMLFFGAAMFSYSGSPLNPIISDLGECSFILWLPTLIVGIILLAMKSKSKPLPPMV